MFNIVRSRRAWWPVTWKGISEEGDIVENRIEMRFRVLKVDDFATIMAEAAAIQNAAAIAIDPVAAAADEAAGGADRRMSQAFARIIERIAEDWRGVCAENGETLPWNGENLALLMNEPRLFDRTIAAFREVTAGGPEQRQGN